MGQAVRTGPVCPFGRPLSLGNTRAVIAMRKAPVRPITGLSRVPSRTSRIGIALLSNTRRPRRRAAKMAGPASAGQIVVLLSRANAGRRLCDMRITLTALASRLGRSLLSKIRSATRRHEAKGIVPPHAEGRRPLIA